MRYHKVSWFIALSPALAVAMAACSSGGSTAPKPGNSPSTSAPVSSAGSATSQITANWEAFFNAKTPEARRVQLLQNGQVFASVIKAQAGSSLASSATAKVTKVAVVSPSQAKVTYTILVGGTPELSNQAGVAVRQGGTWKVGDSSFCGLLALENGGSTSGLPADCRSAS